MLHAELRRHPIQIAKSKYVRMIAENYGSELLKLYFVVEKSLFYRETRFAV